MKQPPKSVSAFMKAGAAAIADRAQASEFIPIKLHPKQQMFADLKGIREALFGGATGGGKTITLLADALKYVHVPQYSALLLRRNFPDLEQEGGLINVAHNWLQNTSAVWSERRREWTFPSGATIRFGFLSTESDKYRYLGGEYQYIGFDELTQFTESQYTYLFSRLRRKESLQRAGVELRVRGATNPGGIGGQWVYERFIPEEFVPEEARKMKVWTKTQPSGSKTAFVPSLLADNPSLDQETYMMSLQELDPITRAQYIRGDWLIQVRGDILYMYSEPHTVISWSEFREVFGTNHIPSHWLIELYQDFGTNKVHPCVTSWFATAAENAPEVNGVPMAGSVFLYRGRMLEQCTAREVGEMMLEEMRPHGEFARIRRFEMSHEAASERMEYLQLGLPATNWPTGSRTRGIEQLKYALTLTDTDKPHPFRPKLRGHPKLYFIVDDDGLVNPKTDAHLARWRAEAVAYKWAETKTGEPNTKLAPHPLFNDAMDTCRAAAANYFPRMEPKSLDELIEERITAKTKHVSQTDPTARSISLHMAKLMSIRELRAEGYEINEFGEEGPLEELGW